MRKITVLAVIISLAVMPIAFANICDNVNSSRYLEATGAKLARGVGNVALCWVEIFRQPMVNQNKWEGVGRGFVQTIVRAGAGVLEVATAIVPGVKIPQPDPSCPADLVNANSSNSSSTSKR